jgi:putative peptide maturation dehydrogenase
MPTLRRSAYFTIALLPTPVPDLEVLLRTGEICESTCKWVAYSAIAGRPVFISNESVRVLSHIPSDRWIEWDAALDTSSAEFSTLEGLADVGLILVSPSDGIHREHLKNETALQATAWHPLAAIYHFCTKWQDVETGVRLPTDTVAAEEIKEWKRAVFDGFTQTHGDPPPHFYSRNDAVGRLRLPKPAVPQADLLTVLLNRRTRRAFDAGGAMSLELVSTLTRYTFGPQGIVGVHKNIFGLGKTSPSGGCLHPTEAYALVLNLEGCQCGLFHYNQKLHSLDCIRELERHAGQDIANLFTAGQQFPRNASVLFILTSRFYRNYWKYRVHPKAYQVLYMDIAHLSQTFYLLCEALGVGAFFTAAINAGNIEKELGLDPYHEGAMAILGCGVPAEDHLGMEVAFSPFEP